jgi:hypothetical protein
MENIINIKIVCNRNTKGPNSGSLDTLKAKSNATIKQGIKTKTLLVSFEKKNGKTSGKEKMIAIKIVKEFLRVSTYPLNI